MDTAAFQTKFIADTLITEATLIFVSKEYYYDTSFKTLVTLGDGTPLQIDSDYSLKSPKANYLEIFLMN
jgi:hypothetical protein